MTGLWPHLHMIRTIFTVALLLSISCHAQEEEPTERPCIRDLKLVTQQAHLWPGTSKKTKNRGWMLQKVFRSNSFYEKIGLMVGDIILEVNGLKTDPKDPHDPAVAELYQISGNRPNKIKIEREGATESIIYTCPY